MALTGSSVDWTQSREKSVNLKKMSVETSKTKMEIEKKKAQERTKYTKTVGQLQRI